MHPFLYPKHQELVKHLRQDFRQNGYVHLPGFFSPTQIQEANDQLAQLLARRQTAMNVADVADNHSGDAAFLWMARLHYYNLYFEELMYESPFSQLASALLEDEVWGEDLSYFMHPARHGAALPPHQDGSAFMIAPWEALCFWVALEDMDHHTGCLHYLRASHHEGLRTHRPVPSPLCPEEIEDYPARQDEVSFPLRAGDLIAHHCLTVHRISPNVSFTRHRQALRFTYFATRAMVDETEGALHLQQASALG
ncbi:MAG: hypothetical protein OHK0039_40980 [Bacteroidia bacterium]